MSRRFTDLALVLVGLALGAWVLAPLSSARAAQSRGSELVAVTAPGAQAGQNVLYVLDPAQMRLLVYEHRVGAKLRLFAVRDMQYEARFQQFPGDAVHEPTVAWVKERVK